MCPNHGDESPESSADATPTNPLPPASVLSHLVDVHCHPTDTSPISDEHISGVQLGHVCAMATHTEDQAKVRELGEKMGDRVVMGFGKVLMRSLNRWPDLRCGPRRLSSLVVT